MRRHNAIVDADRSGVGVVALSNLAGGVFGWPTLPFLAALAVGGCSDVIESGFADYASAKAAGLIERGWVPGWLPPSAWDIREIHNIDSNQSLLRFRFGAADWSGAPPGCSAIAKSDSKGPTVRVDWWPHGTFDEAAWSEQMSYFACENGAAFLLVDRLQGEAFYWRP